MTTLRIPKRSILVVVTAVTLTIAGWPLAASDGAFEISQACVDSGCFPGDPPGFPVLITQAGSYLLTSNLQVPDENTSAIDIDVDEVTLDLGGFAIQGVTDCGVNTLAPCSPTGSGAGIAGASGDRSVIRNGSVRGMGGFGVQAGNQAHIENIRSSSNGLDGISSSGGIVRGCFVGRNGRFGINVSASSVIAGNVAVRNNDNGIDCGGRCTIQGNTVTLSGGVGLRANGTSVVIGNTINNNLGTGLQATPSVGYGQNVLVGNADGMAASQVIGGATQIGTNVCATTTCP